MLTSGFAGLGYQIVWTQQSAAWLGHESAAVLAVVAAFFGGLAIGALTLGAYVDRSPRPAVWYATCEAIVGLWSIVLAASMTPAGRWLLEAIGERPSPALHWAAAFGGTLLLLLPATVAMGATLPAMERVTARLARDRSSLPALYACNTFGAVVGVLTAAFWLVPQFGLTRTAAVCATLNFLCAALTLALFRRSDAAEVATPIPRESTPNDVRWLLAATGLLGIGYEVLVVRVLSEVAENTVYTFAMLLAVYLVGTAIGAALYRERRARRARRYRRSCCGCCRSPVSPVPPHCGPPNARRSAVLNALGSSMSSALAAEAALAIAAFLLPTLAMGALFSHLASRARASGIGFGRALGVNTLGAAFAPWLFGVVLLPLVGAKFALLGIAGSYFALSVAGERVSALGWSIAVAIAAVAAFVPPLAFVDVPTGGRIVSYRDGATASVSVVEDADGVARLRIDNRQQEGSSATRLADARQAVLPLLLHPAPRHALFLGLGTGVTAAAAAEDPDLEVDAVELLPDVIDASAYFRRDDANARLHLIAADARRFVRATSQRYDVVVSDNFHPARAGSAALYTVEHFRAVRDVLATDGLFCQWLPLHQLDLDTLRSIVRSFVTVFPNGWAMLATNSLETPVLGLVARRSAGGFDVGAVQTRLETSRWPRGVAEFGLDDAFAVLGAFVAGPSALARFADDATAQHRRSADRRVSGAAHHVRAGFVAARPAQRADAGSVDRRPTS